MDIIINGGQHYWNKEAKKTSIGFQKPIHEKFMGDGALYIWTYKPEDEKEFHKKMIFFINQLWNFRVYFDNFIKNCSDDIPVIDLPRNIRFGMASGSVYKLPYKSSRDEEDIGYCINLASRLQSYSRDLGFIASARINLAKDKLDNNLYHKVIAKSLKGLPEEIVIVDKESYEELDEQIKSDLFKEIE